MITPEAMREMADRLDKVDCDNIVEAYEAAAMLRSIAAEREADNVTHEWCGDNPNPSNRPKPILEQMADYDEDNWFSE